MSSPLISGLRGLFDPISNGLRGFLDPLGREQGAMPYILSQTAIPVMIPQTSYVGATGLLFPGQGTGATITLSATSGSVTLTLSAAVLAGTTADIGKQFTFWDNGSGLYRSALVTAQGTTTSCTATLASTASGVGPHSVGNYLGFALPANYTSGAWVYLPAGAVSGGSAGFYYCVAANTGNANGFLQITTAYQATMGVPAIPTNSYLNAVGGNGIYSAPTATNITLATVTVPGGAMGPNGSFRLSTGFSVSPTANTKYGNANFASSNILYEQVAGNSAFAQARVWNKGAQNFQLSNVNNAVSGFGYGAPAFYSVDTSTNQPLTMFGQIANAVDYVILEGYTLEVLPSN